jgi:hypothetical protein
MTKLALEDPVAQELERIRAESGGTLAPERVVAAARDPASPLHSRFTWDDGEAAEKWRLHEARNLIRVYVLVLAPGQSEPVRAYVSLTEDRGSAGYRATTDVMSDSERRQALLRQAMREFDAWRRRYEALEELAAVFAAAEQVRRSVVAVPV